MSQSSRTMQLNRKLINHHLSISKLPQWNRSILILGGPFYFLFKRLVCPMVDCFLVFDISEFLCLTNASFIIVPIFQYFQLIVGFRRMPKRFINIIRTNFNNCYICICVFITSWMIKRCLKFYAVVRHLLSLSSFTSDKSSTIGFQQSVYYIRKLVKSRSPYSAWTVHAICACCGCWGWGHISGM